jgi:hypothetical protein
MIELTLVSDVVEEYEMEHMAVATDRYIGELKARGEACWA